MPPWNSCGSIRAGDDVGVWYPGCHSLPPRGRASREGGGGGQAGGGGSWGWEKGSLEKGSLEKGGLSFLPASPPPRLPASGLRKARSCTDVRASGVRSIRDVNTGHRVADV
eukprot:2749624-Rhodomonas_salina.2